jgi:glutamate dehydrogenase/leucine dehydrogenase
MPKKSAYPLRLEEAFENNVDGVSAETGLTKADILRMSMEAGFRAIDWSRMSLKHPPMKDAAVIGSGRVAAFAASCPDQKGAAVAAGNVIARQIRAARGIERAPASAASKPATHSPVAKPRVKSAP